MLNGREKGYRKKRMLVLATLLTALMLVVQVSVPMRVMSQGEEEQPMGWVGDDFIISYPNKQNASHPAIAMTPTNEFTKKEGYAGSVHAVWDEIDETTGIREILYSMSKDGGYTWTGEKEDFIISHTGKANYGDAVNPSISVDSLGRIHVVWTEEYPDGTWEVHYSRSDKNGANWTSEAGDRLVSFIDEKNPNAQVISPPKIVAGVIPDKTGEDILHVVWSEYVPEMGIQEIYYSRSNDSGETWSGSGQNIMVSQQSEPGWGDAFDPAVSTSGPSAEFVHVTWIQREGDQESVYYLRSEDYGQKWNPEMEDTITPSMPSGMLLGNLSMTTNRDELHMVWSQMPKEQKAPAGEIHYSGSPDNGFKWTSQEILTPINNNDEDQNLPMNPSIAVSYMGEAFVFWSEFHEKSIAVHTSSSPAPLEDPQSWTGQKGDIVISNPSEFDVSNVSVTIGELPDGAWLPQVVWEKPIPEQKTLGSEGGDTICAAPSNNEVHYNPPSPPTQHTITATAGIGGSISPSGSVVVTEGDDQSFSISPSTGYHITDVDVDGMSQGAITSYTFYNVNADHTIAAYFAINTYSLTINTDGSGSVIKEPDQITYNHGQSVTLTANPDSGWSFDSWSGHLTGSTNPTSIVMDGDKTVTATFTQNIYNISLTSGWNLVSIPYIQSDTTIASVLSSISGSYDSIKYYDTLSLPFHWKSYRPGSSVNTLTDIDHTMAIWLRTNALCTLSVYGDIPNSTNIQLYAGWNFVGYPSETDRLASNTLPGSADIISVFQVTSPYITDITDLSTVTMSRGNGYWVHVTSDAVWAVDW